MEFGYFTHVWQKPALTASQRYQLLWRELALADHPVTVEQMASTIGSGALFGGLAGGAVGVVGKGIEKGLQRATAAHDGGRLFRGAAGLVIGHV